MPPYSRFSKKCIEHYYNKHNKHKNSYPVLSIGPLEGASVVNYDRLHENEHNYLYMDPKPEVSESLSVESQNKNVSQGCWK